MFRIGRGCLKDDVKLLTVSNRKWTNSDKDNPDVVLEGRTMDCSSVSICEVMMNSEINECGHSVES